MRIAFIGKINNHTQEVASKMALEGNGVFMYVASNNEKTKQVVVHRAIRFKHLPDFSFDFLNNFFATVSAVFGRYDIVHFQNPEACIFGVLVKIFAPSKKVICSFGQQNSKQKVGQWLSAKFSDKVIVLNKKDRVILKRKYGVCAAVVPAGNEDKTTKQIETIYGKGLKDKKYVLTFGKICKESLTHDLIDAFKKLEDTGKTSNNFKLVIAAKKFEDEEYMIFLRSLSYGRKNIVFIESEDEKVLQQLFSHAYLFVEPSVVGSTKKVLLEALGYGLATLVSDVRKNTSVIGKNGFVFEANSELALRDRLAYLLSRQKEVEEMALRAKQKIESEFGWDAVMKKTIEVYRSCYKEDKVAFCMHELAKGSRK